jgi:hypothetical protein
MDESFPYKDKIDDIVVSLYALFSKDKHNVVPDEITEYIESHNLDVSNI